MPMFEPDCDARPASAPASRDRSPSGGDDEGQGAAALGAAALGAAYPGERNRLLSLLAPDDVDALAPHLERVTLATGDVVAAAGAPFQHAYFAESAVFSVIARMADGSAVEVGTVGREGLVGLVIVLGGAASPTVTLCQIPGTARRITAERLAEAVEARPALRRLLLRYAQGYLTQVAQGAACNRLHGIEARCARWLLMTHDRVGGADTFPLKQEFLAVMLGVRRAGVTVAAGALQDAGLIRYRRGSIRVLDRAGLEAASCECYGLVREQYARLLG